MCNPMSQEVNFKWVAIGFSPLISMLPWWIKGGMQNSLPSAHISNFVTHAWKFYYNKVMAQILRNTEDFILSMDQQTIYWSIYTTMDRFDLPG